MTTETERLSTDTLPPTQYLILEVLAARERIGEPSWPFPSRLRSALAALQRLGLLHYDHHNTPKNLRARLTERGRAAALRAGYTVPVTVTTGWGFRRDLSDGTEGESVQDYGEGDGGEAVARSVASDPEEGPGVLMRRTVTYGRWRDVAAEERAETRSREWRARE